MKIITQALLYSAFLLLIACNSNETQNTKMSTDSTVNEVVSPDASSGNMGTYTAYGRTYTGKVTTETLGLKIFKVKCEGDMVQVIEFHFKNEETARKGGRFKPGSMTLLINNEVGIMFGIGYNSKEG